MFEHVRWSWGQHSSFNHQPSLRHPLAPSVQFHRTDHRRRHPRGDSRRCSDADEAAGSASYSAAKADLVILNRAIEIYAAEHEGRFPNKDVIADQLTQFTDMAGDPEPKATSTHIYGPYLRKIPPVPIVPFKGSVQILANASDEGHWYYDDTIGVIQIGGIGGTDEVDQEDVRRIR